MSYADAVQTLTTMAPGQVPAARARALAKLELLAIEIQPEADGELLRMVAQTRRQIVEQA